MLTETEKRVLSEVWGLALRGRRFVPEDAYAELCDDLHVRGWLSRTVNDQGDAAFAWSDQANTALHRTEAGSWN